MRHAQAWIQLWQHRGWINRALLPITAAVYVLWWIRSRWIQPVEIPSVAVVVVGNLWPGGAGKTPVVMALVEGFQHRGFHVGVISRGHGRARVTPLMVQSDSLPQDVGDEPLMIHQRTGAPVAVGQSRVAAAQVLLAQHPDLRILISDDGLQHLHLAHDVSLVLVDERGLGNGWMLPAGPLREPWPRTRRARLREWVLGMAETPMPADWILSRQLAEQAINGFGEQRPIAELTDRPLAAVCGIAKPTQFFQSLSDIGLQLVHTETWPDHHDFEEWQPTQLPAAQWVCTEKDAVKIWRRHPTVWAIPLHCDLPQQLWVEMTQILESRLRSLHGQQTA